MSGRLFARDHKAAGFLCSWSGTAASRGSLHQSLVINHDELALVRPAVPLQEDPGEALALWLPSSRSSGPLSEALAACSSPPSSSSGRDRRVGGVGHVRAPRGREGAVQALAVPGWRSCTSGRTSPGRNGGRLREGPTTLRWATSLTTLGNFLLRSNSQSSVASASFTVEGFQLKGYAIT